MGSGSIGIKLANNKFFPIMDASTEGSKTLELTTVSKNQESVQIHLYRSKDGSAEQTIDKAEYIGTLIIEDIAKKPAGVPTIKLKITLDGNEDLSAEAQDMDSGMYQRLKVSLKDMSREAFAPAPDFDITGIASAGLSNLKDESVEGKSYTESSSDGEVGECAADPPIDAIPAAKVDFFSSSLKSASPDPASASLQEPIVPENLYDPRDAMQIKEKKGIFIPAWLCVLILVVGIALLAAALLFAWRLFSENAMASRAATSQAAFASTQANSPTQAAPAPSSSYIQESDAAAATPSPASFEEEPFTVGIAQEDAPSPSHETDAANALDAETALPAPEEPAPAFSSNIQASGAIAAETALPATEEAEPASSSNMQVSGAIAAETALPAPEEPAPASSSMQESGAIAAETALPAPSQPAPASSSMQASGAIATETALPSPSQPAPASSSNIQASGAIATETALPSPEEPTPPPVWQDNAAAVAVAKPEPPAPPEPAPAAPNVRYQVKWGDTLWDLAQTFYRDPWRFADIARHNNIKNPSLIVVGTYIEIPAK